MKIGIEGLSLNEPLEGAGRYLSCLAEHLRAAGPGNEYVLLLRKPLDAPKLQALAGVKTKVLGMTWPRSRWLWANLRLPFGLAGENFDLLHFPFYMAPLSVRRGFVVTVHDVAFEAHPEWFGAKARFAFRAFSRGSAERAGAVITVSEFSKKEIIKYFGIPEKKVFVTYPGVSGDFSPGAKRAGGTDGGALERHGINRPYILCVGDISRRKNAVTLLNAFKELRKKHDVQMVIVGRTLPPHPPAGGIIEALGLAGRVVSAEKVPDADLVELYRSAACYASASLYEGFGIPAIEALACGTPVVLSDIEVYREVCGDAGTYVNPGDAGSIAEGLAAALSGSAEITRRAGYGVERAKKYSCLETARKTLEIYER